MIISTFQVHLTHVPIRVLLGLVYGKLHNPRAMGNWIPARPSPTT
jgi:hypothetical protein